MIRSFPFLRCGTISAFLFLIYQGFAAEAEPHQEENGVLIFEAEDFHQQTLTETRQWHRFHAGEQPRLKPDADPPHLDGASGGSYLEILPDTRKNHGEKLIDGENFSNVPGELAILHYRTRFTQPGRYFVWLRAYSTGTEDNGLHVGLNGAWPESGQRWQTTVKNRWHWECRQRTEKVHVGVPMQLFLDIPSAGEHEILLSMREDGFELDQVLLSNDPAFRPPAFPEVKPGPHGSGNATVTGDLKRWHRTTIELDGPFASETGGLYNPFTDRRFDVLFQHPDTGTELLVPGYFAADGDAAQTGASSGTVWKAHFTPEQTGRWNYTIHFATGSGAALDRSTGEPLAPYEGVAGSFEIAETDRTTPDLRARGRLQYIGERYLQFAGDGTRFLKAGPDAPETFLAYRHFDGTRANSQQGPLKTWKPHVADWQEGDPLWRGQKGKGIIGAINYLSEKGMNAFSFLTYNAGGDGDNVWPFVERDAKMHYDCSKLDQWEILFSHASAKGLYLHFKLQETEIDDNRVGHKNPQEKEVPTSLDGGELGSERKLYCREIVARFGHHLALNWNIGEENTQSPAEVRQMARYIRQLDPYDHHIVIHTYPGQQNRIYPPLLGDRSPLTGASLQTHWNRVHQQTRRWVEASEKEGRPWVVANDEQNPPDLGVPPDPGYQGFSGTAKPKEGQGPDYDLHDIRRDTLWGNLMAGGAGVEYYFGYRLPENDLACQDLRSRDQSWDYCRIALEFFHQIPFWEMESADHLVGNPKGETGKPWCLAQEGEVYLVYAPAGSGAVEPVTQDDLSSYLFTILDPETGQISEGHDAVTDEKKDQVLLWQRSK